MRLSTEHVKTSREWKASTGLSQEEYEKLLKLFEKHHLEKYGMRLSERCQETGIEYCIRDENDLLYMTLFSLKNSITYDALGLIFGMVGSNAKRQQQRGIELLEETLKKEGYTPKSELNEADLEEFLNQFEELIIDATEQRIQRPSDPEKQRDYYSGKKKAHTVKQLVFSDSSKWIHYLSPYYKGKTHDYSLLKSLFDPAQDYFKKLHIRVDLGFLGFGKDYEYLQLDIPHKKSKNKPLTEEEKEENREYASKRICVEHSIGGMKRYRFMMERLRIHNFGLYNKISSVCAGLWNYSLAN